jgi:protein-L-isoaspartate(D-aspartate) O-methyltransferase
MTVSPCSPSQQALVNHLIKTASLPLSSFSTQAMLRVDRGMYAPMGNPYFDSPQPIGHGQTISAPHMHAQALRLAEEYLLKVSMKSRETKEIKILDVGCGSGYLVSAYARLLEEMKFKSHLVVGVELCEDLVNLSMSNIRAADKDLIENHRLTIHQGDGWSGFKSEAPYDFIHVGASAPAIPLALQEQLKEKGRLMIPIGEGYEQDLSLCEKREGSLQCTKLESVLYVPLVRENEQQSFTDFSAASVTWEHSGDSPTDRCNCPGRK